MSNLVRSRTVYKAPVIVAVVTMLALMIALPVILNQVAPSLESWSAIIAWLTATSVGLAKYALDNQATN